MPSISMNQLGTYRWSMADDAYHYQRAGFESIGLWRRKVEDFGLERSAEVLADHGLAVSHLAWAGGFTGSDGRSWLASVADTKRAMECAAFLNARQLQIYAGGRNCHTRRHAERLLESALEELLPAAEEQGVVLALKPVHPKFEAEWSYLYDLDQTIEIVSSYDSAWLRLMVDTYHFDELASNHQQIERLAPITTLLQLGDRKGNPVAQKYRCRIGKGVIGLPLLVDRFVNAGFTGQIDINVFGATNKPEEYDALLVESMQIATSWIGSPKVQPASLPR